MNEEEQKNNDTDVTDVYETAAVCDGIEMIADVDDEPDNILFVLGLSLAGFVAGVFGCTYAADNPIILCGAAVFLISYTILMIRVMPYFLIAGGFIIGGCLNELLVYGTAGTALGVAFIVIRYLVPSGIIRNMKKAAWFFMFAGSAAMIIAGATITGTCCAIIAGIWGMIFLLSFLIEKGICAVFRKGKEQKR